MISMWRHLILILKNFTKNVFTPLELVCESFYQLDVATRNLIGYFDRFFHRDAPNILF